MQLKIQSRCSTKPFFHFRSKWTFVFGKNFIILRTCYEFKAPTLFQASSFLTLLANYKLHFVCYTRIALQLLIQPKKVQFPVMICRIRGLFFKVFDSMSMINWSLKRVETISLHLLLIQVPKRHEKKNHQSILEKRRTIIRAAAEDAIDFTSKLNAKLLTKLLISTCCDRSIIERLFEAVKLRPWSRVLVNIALRFVELASHGIGIQFWEFPLIKNTSKALKRLP